MSNHDQGATRREFLAAGASMAAVATFGFSRIAEAGDESKYVTQLVHFTLLDGKDEQAMEFLKELTEKVEKNEPGVLVYIANRSVKEPKKVTFVEVYKDQDAVNNHTRTDYFKAMMPKFGEYFEQAVDFVPMQRVAGFTRES